MTEPQPTPVPGSDLRRIIEALLFAADEPLTFRQMEDIFDLLDRERQRWKITQDLVRETIDSLNAEYEHTGSAFRIVKVAGGHQFATRPEFGIWLGAMLHEKAKRKLSVSALESLAIIAYKQPVTKPELETIRGVNADYVLRTLLERNLVTIVGRAATPGRPLLYGTTREFLKHFGINDLSELPKPREIDELMAEAEFEVQKRLLQELEEKQGRDEGEDGDAGTEGGTMTQPGDDNGVPVSPSPGAA